MLFRSYLSALGPHADPSQAEAAAQRLLQTPRPESISDGDWAVITAKAHKGYQVKAEIGRALYHLARASVYDQEGCLDPQLRARLLEFCRQVYRNYGDKGDAGFEHLLDIVRSDPHPPAGFTIAALGSTK